MLYPAELHAQNGGNSGGMLARRRIVLQVGGSPAAAADAQGSLSSISRTLRAISSGVPTHLSGVDSYSRAMSLSFVHRALLKSVFMMRGAMAYPTGMLTNYPSTPG